MRPLCTRAVAACIWSSEASSLLAILLFVGFVAVRSTLPASPDSEALALTMVSNLGAGSLAQATQMLAVVLTIVVWLRTRTLPQKKSEFCHGR